MNNMIRFKDKLINKDYIYYIEEHWDFQELHIISSCLNKFIISYKDKEEFMTEIKYLRKFVGLYEMERLLLNLDNIVGIETYKDKVLKKEKDFMQITFCNNNIQPLIYELEGLMYELDEPGDIMDDIILRFKILERKLLEYAYSNL